MLERLLIVLNSFEDLEKASEVEFFPNQDLTRYTTFRLKVYGDLCVVKSINALKSLLSFAKNNKLIIHILGWGANQIINDTKKKLFIKLDFQFDRSYLNKVRDEYDLPASVSLNILQSHAQKFGLKGWEVITGIPASLGGAIFMNAGTNLGEICEIINEVTFITKSGEIKKHNVKKESFSYRKNNFLDDGDIIISAKLFHHGLDPEVKEKIKTYMQMRKDTQPLKSFNCGCVFKNLDVDHRAGQFIDSLCLKELKFEGLRVSPRHANFIENTGEPTSGNFIEFSDHLIRLIELHSGIKFELEVKVY